MRVNGFGDQRLERRSQSAENLAIRALIDVAQWASEVAASTPRRARDIARVLEQTTGTAKGALRDRERCARTDAPDERASR